MMRARVVVPIVVVVALAVAELTAPRWVAAGIDRDVRGETEGRVVVASSVSGPPTIFPVITTGHIDWMEMDIIEVLGAPLPLDVVLRAEDIDVDRSSILRGDTRVRRVGRASLLLHADLGGDLPPLLRPFADAAVGGALDALLSSDFAGIFGARDDGSGFSIGDDIELDVEGGIAGCEAAIENLVLDVECALTDVPPFILDALR